MGSQKWQYLKNFLEGDSIPVARPKNRGGDTDFKSDAPVFLTAPQEVSLYRGKKRDENETGQMRTRIKCVTLRHTFGEQFRVEAGPCGPCGAKVYLEGCGGAVPGAASSSDGGGHANAMLASGAAHLPVLSPSLSAEAAASLPPPKRQRTGADIVHELKQLAELQAAGCIDADEFNRLKAKILADV